MLILQCTIVGGIHITILMFNFFKEIKSNILLGILLLDTPVAHPHIYKMTSVPHTNTTSLLILKKFYSPQGLSPRSGPETVLAPVHSRTNKYRRRKEK